MCGTVRKWKSGLKKGEVVAYRKATEKAKIEALCRNAKSVAK